MFEIKIGWTHAYLQSKFIPLKKCICILNMGFVKGKRRRNNCIENIILYTF